MFKGIPQSERNQGWHIKHMAALKRRKRLRLFHLSWYKKFGRPQTNQEIESRAEEAYQQAQKREAEHSWLYWLFKRWYVKLRTLV